MKWTPFQRASYEHIPTVDELRMRFGVTAEDARRLIEEMETAEVFINNRYQVQVRPHRLSINFPAMLHLSIKRIDREPIHDWRDLQRIKNEIVGTKHEAVELYPSEDRMVDGANQYHLWVLADPKKRFPFGFFDGRMVATPEQAEKAGAKQRAFDHHTEDKGGDE